MRQFHFAFPLLKNFQSAIGKSSTVAFEISARLLKPCPTVQNRPAIKQLASVCGRRAETVERRRRDGGNEVGAQRRRRAADGSLR